MKCCICGKKINSKFDSNSSYPFFTYSLDADDYICCTDCNKKYVKRSRELLGCNNFEVSKISEVFVGDTIIIFSSNVSKIPIEFLICNNIFLTGVVKKITNKNGKKTLKGTWGDFIITENDSFLLLKGDVEKEWQKLLSLTN